MAESINTIYGNALILPSISGGAKETWMLNKIPSVGRIGLETTINFTSNDTKYSKIQTGTLNVGGIRYDDTLVYDPQGSDDENLLWVSSAYRKLTFDTPPTGDLLTWLQANGVKQPDDTAIQDTKAVTIISNGTVSVTPDAPYDALKKVDVTVDVASGGGTSTVTFTKAGMGANIYYLDLDGVWRNENITTSVKTITIRQYSPFLLGSMYMNVGLSNVNNLEEATMDSTIIINNYTTKIYYATASVASATLPSD